MRAAVARLVTAGWVAVLVGCGSDENDTNVFVGVTPTPKAGERTATPVASATPDDTPTGDVATSTPTVAATASSAAMPSVTATPGATATPGPGTPTTSAAATPVPTATAGGPIDADVRRIADDILPFLVNTTLLTGGSIRARTVVPALRTDPCPDGGTRDDDEEAPARTLTFHACRVVDALGSFEFDGQVVITIGGFEGGGIAFDFTVTDLATSHAVAFLGTLTLEIDDDGFLLNGPLAVTTPEGNFTLVANDVTINASRKIIAGAGSVTDDADNFGLQTVAFAVTRRGAASNLTVTFDDATVRTYTLDLATGELPQTS